MTKQTTRRKEKKQKRMTNISITNKANVTIGLNMIEGSNVKKSDKFSDKCEKIEKCDKM